MVGKPKKVNEHYFDLEGRTSDDLKQRYYVLGAFYACYTPLGHKGIEFRSRHRDLVQIVKDQLQSKHTLLSYPYEASHLLQMHSVPYLRDNLEEMGLVEDKPHRRFPSQNVPLEYMSHFIRGFLDAKARIYDVRHTINMIISFNQGFLTDMNSMLVRLVQVRRGAPTGDKILYSHADAVVIYNFIYSNWDFIERNGLYVPSNKYELDKNIGHQIPEHPSRVKAIEKMEEAKRLLPHMTAIEVGRRLGYKHSPNFLQTFREITGQTTSQFKQQVKDEARRQRLKAPIRINYIGPNSSSSGSYKG